MTTIGDRSSLFQQLASTWPLSAALYPGSYVDASPSTAIPRVVYVDADRRAARDFSDRPGLLADLESRTQPGAAQEVIFHHQDYTTPLPLDPASMDLLISLFAGPVWDHCRTYLRPRGLLLANTSHGDASVAALDPELELVAAIHHRADRYHLDTSELDSYLIPRVPAHADATRIRELGRGITYTRTAFAYLFRRR